MIVGYKRLLQFICRNYKILFLQVAFICCFFFSFAQFNVRFDIVSVPPGHVVDSIFVGGSFNNWKPGEQGNAFSKVAATGFININNVAAGTYEFKFTRGSWESVECNTDGTDIGNRTITVSSDTVISISILSWKDNFIVAAKKHTASRNVHIIDTAFAMPQLGRTRRIWLYLPPGYKKNKKRYPVMYMQDGQNLFDEYTSGFGEWGVDECVDSMIRNGKPPCIIVGIDNGPKRLNEYNPYDFKEGGKGEGDQYVDFIARRLKPYIDRRYRTLRGSNNTIIAGSSMGGLISYYAMLKYPAIFGKGGIFSPAFWTANEIKSLTDSSGKELKGTLFFYIGAREGEKYVADMNAVIDKLGMNSSALIFAVIDPEGDHNEGAWRKWFPEFYKWVTARGFNNVIKLDDD